MNIPVVVAPLDDITTRSTETAVHKRQIAKMAIIIIFDFLDVLPIV